MLTDFNPSITNLALYRFHHYCRSLNYWLRSAAP